MKHKLVVAWFSVILLLVSYSLSHGDNRQDQPNAVMLNNSYQFDKIPDGIKIVHDFVLQNRGNAPLEIPKIHTG